MNKTTTDTSVHWKWSSFSELSNSELYSIMAVRQEVFVVEQNCIYLDADGIDAHSWHLTGTIKDEIVAYLRVVHPGIKYKEPSIGRVLTTKKARGTGVGRQLTSEAIRRTKEIYPTLGIRISAQEYLRKFYASFGFEAVSAPYLEDNIPHIEMVLR